MASLKDIRKRISSVRSTQQITKAMKMVAAAKLRRAQDAVQGARPYADRLTTMLSGLAASGLETDAPLLGAGSGAPAHVVLLTSDRGLCGGYNANLLRTAVGFFDGADGEAATLTVCGRRGHDHFRKRLADRVVSAHVNRAEGLDVALAAEVADEAAKRFAGGECGSVYLVFSRFKSAISQHPVLERLLPLAGVTAPVDESTAQNGTDETVQGEADGRRLLDYLFEPDPASILAALVPRYLRTRVYQAMLEATASEHGARMTAMDSATRNASEMIERLTLEMNRARQAMITTELMEIVGGAEALKG